MYNRYIPQSDGTFRRSRVNEPAQIRTPQKQEEKAKPPSSDKVQTFHPPKSTTQRARGNPASERNPLGFLSQLLPKDFDTGDLLVILLLLLMSGENGEDQSTVLLTLILYLFL